MLSTIAAAGVVGLAITAPKATSLLKYVDSDWMSKREPVRRLRELAYRMKKKALVEFKKERRRTILRITDRGKRTLVGLPLYR